ncbi:MAG: hypothetical protein Q4B43_03050, partial [Bacteroidota bacterium]|nr:hypothetical protein [Bacteroidota bacterium]
KIREFIGNDKKLEAVAYCVQTYGMDLQTAKFLVENIDDIEAGKMVVPEKTPSKNYQKCTITTENGKTSVFYQDSTTSYAKITPQHPKWKEAKKLLPNKKEVFEAMEKDTSISSPNKNTLFIQEKNKYWRTIILIIILLLVFFYFWLKF